MVASGPPTRRQCPLWCACDLDAAFPRSLAAIAACVVGQQIRACFQAGNDPKLLEHAEVITVRPVIDDLSVLHPVPVDVLDNERLACRRYAHQQSTVDWQSTDAAVSRLGAVTAACR